ncbi:hypothetical protein BOX37_23595 [Nocardia mangyaensis]|uniref:Uncharacterized protein n=1 Tax=Nocardia mangyaensis TaxID=2213200 RepID=A0A1J0VWK5_9NOCA|nr:hypothetical protein BOX37_23595 [Nocardia mangyaensis]
MPPVVTFTPGNQSATYKKHGTWTGDVVYASDSGFSNRMFWTLVLDPSVQAIITNNTMSCVASADGIPGYHDRHPAVPADYKWHSTIKDLALDTPYTWRAHCAFGTAEGPGEVKFAVSFVMRP